MFGCRLHECRTFLIVSHVYNQSFKCKKRIHLYDMIVKIVICHTISLVRLS